MAQEHPVVGANLNDLALLYRTQGRYAKAEPLYKRALAIGEKCARPRASVHVATYLNNLAELYRVQRSVRRG